jgi:hypothetical protein
MVYYLGPSIVRYFLQISPKKYGIIAKNDAQDDRYQVGMQVMNWPPRLPLCYAMLPNKL